MIRVSNIKLSIEEDTDNIIIKLAKKLKINREQIIHWKIFKQSIDARKANEICFVYTIDAEIDREVQLLERNINKDIIKAPDLSYIPVSPGEEKLNHPPVVVGTGPAGLFAGLLLAQAGFKPLILERGEDVDARTQTVRHFWATGELNLESNVQFGEGGAGTFSDGKLTTLIKDTRCRKILEEFVAAGAPKEILYSHKPHVGTDILKNVVKNIRNKIIALGGNIYFNSKVTEFITENGLLEKIVVNNNKRINTEALILAIGHSSRDTFEILLNSGVSITPKAFSVGFRIEHPQKIIDLAQYKKYAGHKRLGPAEYKLVYHSPSGRSAYTFCMCPGGKVVGAASEEGCLVTNGMSEYARSEENANSAVLVSITPQDFGSDHPLAGVEFQKIWERKAFQAGGSDFTAPIQMVGDFLADRPSQTLGCVKPSYTGRVKLTNLSDCLPEYAIKTIREAIINFNSQLKDFALPEAIITGVETRSSSPVRINRDANQSSNIRGIYPAGEGAGYAGGIISAAADGMKAAEEIIRHYDPLSIKSD